MTDTGPFYLIIILLPNQNVYYKKINKYIAITNKGIQLLSKEQKVYDQ